MNRQNETSITGKHAHTHTQSRLRLEVQRTVKTLAVSFTTDCLLGTAYLQYLSRSLLVCSAAIWARESQIMWEIARYTSFRVCLDLSHLVLLSTKANLACVADSQTDPPSPCYFLSLSCPWMPLHPPRLPWRWWWGMPAWPEVGAGWLSHLLTKACSLDRFMVPDIRRWVCMYVWVLWRIGEEEGGRGSFSLILVANTAQIFIIHLIQALKPTLICVCVSVCVWNQEEGVQGKPLFLFFQTQGQIDQQRSGWQSGQGCQTLGSAGERHNYSPQ